ncbi:MAG: O-antigen ligase family protein [Trueperaceae bacterium]|nr:MAG: O-antigen ligase family protein [Trueperaceae bacterium]
MSNLKTLYRKAVPAALLLLPLGYFLWSAQMVTFQAPPWWVAALGLGVLALYSRRVPWPAWLYWGWGGITLLWSLAPGHTLVWTLWSIVFLAAMMAGRWLPGFWLLNLPLLFLGIDAGLLLYHFGYTTGEEPLFQYAYGAQALLLVPLLAVTTLKQGRNWTLVLLALLLSAALFSTLISGARAVYLPLLVVVMLGGYRIVREGMDRKRILLAALVVVGSLALVDGLLSYHPVRAALARNLVATNQLIRSEEGGVGSRGFGTVEWRLRMWEQTGDIALKRPFGAGAGSFPAVIHAYQQYPMLWSNNPHNVLMETLAQSGWVGLLLLLLLLGWPMIKVWPSGHWPFALAVGGFWSTFIFDIHTMSPAMMLVAFWSLGALWKLAEGEAPTVSRSVNVKPLGVVLAFGLVLWWYLPCQSDVCSVERHLGHPEKVLPRLAEADPASRDEVLEMARSLYPQSLWVLQADLLYAVQPEERLRIIKETSLRFPFQHPRNYLRWAELASSLGKDDEVEEAISLGLQYFPPDAKVNLGRRRGLTREAYDQLITSLIANQMPQE